jgi:hypothetical protein
MTNEIPSKLEQRIRQRAFEIWMQEGQPHGRDKEHWNQATDEILSKTTQPLPPNLLHRGEGESPTEAPATGGNNPDDLTR